MFLSDIVGGGSPMIASRNATVGVAFEDINPYDVSLDQSTILATAAAAEVTSSSTNDDGSPVGTGARTVRIFGLDANWNFQTETLTLNGRTAVIGTATWRRVFGAEVLTVGTLGVNEGDIYIIKTGTSATWTNGVPDTLTSALAKILAGYVSGMNGFFTTPAEKSMKLKKLWLSAKTQACYFRLLVKDNVNDTMWRPLPFYIDLAAGVEDCFELDLSINQKTDVKVQAFAAGASGVVIASMRFGP